MKENISKEEQAVIQYMNNIYKKLEERDPHEKEFLQSVKILLDSLIPIFVKDRTYSKHNILEHILEHERVIFFRVPWIDDAGKGQVNSGYRVQYNSAIGPYKGGIRFHPSVNLSVMKFLAVTQIFKNALTGQPIGGGKGGSDFNPKGRSDNEVMRFCQSFMTELSKHIGVNIDTPAGDIGVGGREIGYLFGQYKRLKGSFAGVLTGKDTSFGGSLIRPEATGYGAVYFAKEMLKARGDSLEGKRVVVSGSGNVAQYTTEKCIELGAIVVTLSDSSGYIYDPAGVDKEKMNFVLALKNERRGRIHEYAEKFGVEYFEGETPWAVDCDVAFPDATQNEIKEEDAKKLIANGCIAVVEGANMPCTQKAIDQFEQAGTLYGPGKAANAGGVAVSGLEMSQNSLRYTWTREEVDRRLQNIMKRIHEKCVTYGRESDDYINYEKGANIAG